MIISSVIKNEPMHAKFVIENSSTSYVNALRRIIISDIPTPGIHRVDFQINETDFVPEVLAHQIGMIGVRMPESITTTELVLDLHNEGEGALKVHSRNLVPQDKRVEILNPGTLLGYMAPGQRLKLSAFVQLGTVRDHAKWTCCHCTFSYVPEVRVHQSRLVDEKKESLQMADMCPNNVFDIEDGIITAPRSEQCNFCGECTSLKHRIEGVDISVQERPGMFIFEVESYGAFTVSQILRKATEELDRRLVAVEQRVDRDLPCLPRTPPTSPEDGLN